MKSLMLTAYFVALLFVHVFSDCVNELSDDDFEFIVESNINKKVTTLVMFYAPWCGHCKQMKPEFEKACDLLRQKAPHIHLAKVDCTEAGKETCNRFNVRGYPTVKVFTKDLNSPDDFTGDRKADGIVDNIIKVASEDVQKLDSIVDFKDFIESATESFIVGEYKSPDNEDLSTFAKSYEKAAHLLKKKYSFVKSSAEAIKKACDFELRNNFAIVYPRFLHSKFQPKCLAYGEEKIDVPRITAFIKENIQGVLGYRTPANQEDFLLPLIVAYYDVDYERNLKGTNYWRNRIYKAVHAFMEQSSKVKYTVAISSKNDFRHKLDDAGIEYSEISKTPMIVVTSADGKNYVLPEFTGPALEKFLNDVDNGDVEAVLKSEPIPEDNDGPVKVGVAKNFDDLVFKGGKDSLIKFYAPWCGHCKKLAPVIEELGEKMKNENVNIIKFDATANFVDSRFHVQGYPTIYWVSKTGAIESYEGGRELNDFITFISKRATDELEKFDRSGLPKKVEL